VTERQRPFYCGSQVADWQARNCLRCQKMPLDEDGYPTPETPCDIDREILVGMFDDGSIDGDIARRMGWSGNVDEYTWDCPERVPRV